MESSTTNHPRVGEFFKLRPDARRGGKGHGVVFENEKALLTPPRLILKPKAGGFPPLRERPRLVYHPHAGVPPQDLEGGMSGIEKKRGFADETEMAVFPDEGVGGRKISVLVSGFLVIGREAFADVPGKKGQSEGLIGAGEIVGDGRLKREKLADGPVLVFA